jgi:hypothetical protein
LHFLHLGDLAFKPEIQGLRALIDQVAIITELKLNFVLISVFIFSEKDSMGGDRFYHPIAVSKLFSVAGKTRRLLELSMAISRYEAIALHCHQVFIPA